MSVGLRSTECCTASYADSCRPSFGRSTSVTMNAVSPCSSSVSFSASFAAECLRMGSRAFGVQAVARTVWLRSPAKVVASAQAAGGARTTTSAQPKRRRQARLGGFDLHADTSVRAKNRPRLERLCRYLLRPPIAEDRSSFASDGRVLVRLKTPWRDGTDHIALEPQELLERLAALIPRPYTNLIVYHGVLAPNARWRGEWWLVSGTRSKTPEAGLERFPEGRRPMQSDLGRAHAPRSRNRCAAVPRLRRRMRFVAAIMLSSAIRRILRHLGLPAGPVELAPARAPPGARRRLGLLTSLA